MQHSGKHKNIHIELFGHSSQLPPNWDELLPEGHFLQSAQLSIYEQVQLPDISFLYALISANDIPLAVAYFQVLRIRKKHLNTEQMKPLQAQAWKAFTSMTCPKLLVAGHLFRHDICSYYWKEGVAPFEAFQWYQEAIRKSTRKSGAAAALVKDVNEVLIPYFQHYAPEYMQLRNDISMEMDIPETWETMAHYEKAVKHKYAQRYRKVRQPWEQLEITELSVEGTEAQKNILYGLYREVSARQPVRLGMLSEDFLPALKRNNPENLRIWLASENGKPVAFFSAWTHNSTFDMFYIGFDYNRNDALQLYFNILFFSVEQAIMLGKKKLILGRTALEAKARLGCRPRYLSTYLYIRNRMLRNIITRLQQNITSMEGEWENRHPFKNPPPASFRREGVQD